MRLLSKIALGIVPVGMLTSIAVLIGCSDLREELPNPSASGIRIHDPSWTDAASRGFHGNSIRASNWDMSSCKSCHGPRYEGGIVIVSCKKCHDASMGPEDCTTCHGSGANAAPPRDLSRNTVRSARGVGAHQAHFVGTSIAAEIFCSTCHNVPASLYAPGHVDSPLPAEVTIRSWVATKRTNDTTSAFWDPSRAVFRPIPSYDQGSLSCSGTYCHGYFKNGNTTIAPVWNDTTGAQSRCGTCHGDVTRPTLAERARPGGTHDPTVTQCYSCHYKSSPGDLINASLNFVDRSKHVDGKLSLWGQERDF
jgi:predicted CxxxxCH...CXXCH cytochrome family protein